MWMGHRRSRRGVLCWGVGACRDPLPGDALERRCGSERAKCRRSASGSAAASGGRGCGPRPCGRRDRRRPSLADPDLVDTRRRTDDDRAVPRVRDAAGTCAASIGMVATDGDRRSTSSAANIHSVGGGAAHRSWRCGRDSSRRARSGTVGSARTPRRVPGLAGDADTRSALAHAITAPCGFCPTGSVSLEDRPVDFWETTAGLPGRPVLWSP